MPTYSIELTKEDFSELIGFTADKLTELEDEIDAAQSEDDGDDGGNVDPETAEQQEIFTRLHDALSKATVVG
jgi:hypothetical protein